MQKKHIMRIISLIMLVIAVVFFALALTHPEFGTTFYIGSLEIGSSIWREFYLLYVIVMIGLFIASCLVSKKGDGQ
mgnify:FL=1